MTSPMLCRGSNEFFFIHIYIELITKVDALSKEALTLQVGSFSIYEFLDDVEIESMEFHF